MPTPQINKTNDEQITRISMVEWEDDWTEEEQEKKEKKRKAKKEIFS